MITVEDKIRTFSKYVYDKEIKQREEILKEELAKQEHLRKESETRLHEESEKQEVKQKKKLDLEAQRMIAGAKTESRNLRHKVKRTIHKDLTKSILQAIGAYAETKEYEEWVASKLAEIVENSDEAEILVWLTEKDRLRLEEQFLKKHPEITIHVLDVASVGGILVEFPESGTRMDYTLKSRLEEMENEIGLQLNEVLNEAVIGND